MSIEQNKATVEKFVDAVNRQDYELLREVTTPVVAEEWTETFVKMHVIMQGHHIDVVDMVAEGDCVSVKMATSGYHTGDIFGIPATGKWWTNRVFTYFRIVGGRVAEFEPLADAENHIKQIGGIIVPMAQITSG